ncbi:aminotransferase class IV [Psychrobacter lutiphocae]|uniref:aminotransferase class IV n=1 Tax=Psychrobacter lutiphocae TaxID=540500 RepID=UPI00035EDE45|nr:aminotransferase class IV [Psychrobacter lutiphocae]
MIWYQLSATGLLPFSDKQPDGKSAAPIKASLLAQSNTSLTEHANHPSTLIAPMLRGLAYGDGFFTTIGVDQGQLLWQSYHQQRVQQHCQALQLCYPSAIEQQLWYYASQLAQQAVHGIVKIIISRQTQTLRGYAYDPELSHNTCLIWLGVTATAPLADAHAPFLSPQSGQVILQQPPVMATCLSARLASMPAPLAGLKSLNRLDGVMIAGELQRHKLTYPDLAEGLVADLVGNWTEGVMSNVFYQLHSDETVWYTPPLDAAGVKGVMRQVIMDQMKAQGRPVIERTLQNGDLLDVSTMFFCNAVRGVMPVHTLLLGDQRLALSVSGFETR